MLVPQLVTYACVLGQFHPHCHCFSMQLSLPASKFIRVSMLGVIFLQRQRFFLSLINPVGLRGDAGIIFPEFNSTDTREKAYITFFFTGQ